MADSSSQLGGVDPAYLGAAHGVALSEDQKTFIKDLVAKYDVASLSKADHHEIRAALKAEGIGPSRAVADELHNLGVKPPPGGLLSGPPIGPPRGGPPPGGPPPAGPPPPTDEELSAIEEILQEILNGYDLENLTDDDQAALQDELKAATAGTSVGRAFDVLI